MTVPSTPATATASVAVAAPAESVYALVTDLDAMGQIAEETTAMTWISGDRAVSGAVFTGTNRNGKRSWSTSCRVSEADLARVFAFEVSVARMPVATWAYQIEPLGAKRCRVTESTWDRRPRWFKKPGEWATGVPDRAGANQVHIEATLQRLKARAESDH